MLLTEFDEKSFKKAMYDDGYEDGIKDGELKGRLEGRLEERNENLLKTIELLKSLNLSNETIINMISEKYDIPEEDISQKL